MNVFRAESGQFYLHDANMSAPDRETTALINLSWKYTDQYIKYYHEMDPFTTVATHVQHIFQKLDVNNPAKLINRLLL